MMDRPISADPTPGGSIPPSPEPTQATEPTQGGGTSPGTEPGGGGDHGRLGGRRPRPVFLLVGVVLAVGLGIGLFTGVGTHRGSGGRPVTGSAVPRFSLPRLGGGGRVGVPADGGGDGHPAVIVFFASWCGPCQKELPGLAGTYRREQETGSRLARVAMIGVDGNDPAGKALAFVHRSGVTFPVGADRTYTVTEGLFYFTSLPESVFVEGDGTIAGIHYGGLTRSELVDWQRRLLATG